VAVDEADADAEEELLPEDDEPLPEQPAIATAATGTAPNSQRRDTVRPLNEVVFMPMR